MIHGWARALAQSSTAGRTLQNCARSIGLSAPRLMSGRGASWSNDQTEQDWHFGCPVGIIALAKNRRASRGFSLETSVLRH